MRLVRPMPPLMRQPISHDYGFDRGTPIDRYYISDFIDRHAGHIRGRVLEVKSADYTNQFGHDVDHVDVLDIDDTNRLATVVADLQDAAHVPSDQYDCFIVTQTLQYVFDLNAAIEHSHRFLRPGGVMLATVPTCLQMDKEFIGGEYWRLTAAACQRLFGRVFGDSNVSVEAHGNYIATTAMLAGVAVEDLSSDELDKSEAEYPIVSCVVACKK